MGRGLGRLVIAPAGLYERRHAREIQGAPGGNGASRVPHVVIGVPVLNGALYLERCLKALTAQDHRDLAILVSDNASTDATPEIAARFAAADPRVRVIRQQRTLPVAEHFLAVRDAADCRYFAWRAHDDWCDANWVSALAGLLDRDRAAKLAVSRVVLLGEDNRLVREIRFPEQLGLGWRDRVRLLTMAPPQWIYGLFRIDALREIDAAVRPRYPHIWSQDFAFLMRAALVGGMVGTNGTCFYSLKSLSSRQIYFPTHWRQAWRHYADFWTVAREAARDSSLPLAARLQLYAVLPSYTRGRTEKLRRIARGWLNEQMGGAGLTRPRGDRGSRRRPAAGT